jgi:hypothetical protein
VCTDLAAGEFEGTYIALGRILRSRKTLTPDETAASRRVFDFAFATVSARDLAPSKRTALFTFLRGAAGRLMQKQKLLGLVNSQPVTEEYSLFTLTLLIDVVIIATSIEPIRAYLLLCAQTASGAVAKALTRRLQENSARIRGSEFAFRLAGCLAASFPAGDDNQRHFLYLLTTYRRPISVIRGSAWMPAGSSQSALEAGMPQCNLSSRSLSRAGPAVDFAGLDLLGGSALPFLSRMDGPLLRELLEAGFLPPANLRHAVALIGRDSLIVGDFFDKTVSLLAAELRTFGTEFSAALREGRRVPRNRVGSLPRSSVDFLIV